MLDAINLRRDDFVKFSDGSSMFDTILDRLLIPRGKQKTVFEIRFQIDSSDYVEARNESGRLINREWLYKVETRG